MPYPQSAGPGGKEDDSAPPPYTETDGAVLVSHGIDHDLAPGTLVVAVGPGASGKSTYADTANEEGVTPR